MAAIMSCNNIRFSIFLSGESELKLCTDSESIKGLGIHVALLKKQWLIPQGHQQEDQGWDTVLKY